MSSDQKSLIDETISIVALQAERYTTALKTSAELTQKYAQAVETSDLRHALETIVAYAEGNAPACTTLEDLDRAIQTVLVLLFFNPLLDETRIPMSFHQTPLGRIINQARTRLIWLGDACNITEASKELNVSRRTIYDWIELGRLAPVWMGEQPLIPRIQIAVLRGYVNRNLHQMTEALQTIRDPMVQRAIVMLSDPALKKSMEEAMKDWNDPLLKEMLNFPTTPAGREMLNFPNTPTGKEALRFASDPAAHPSVQLGMEYLTDPIVKQMQRALQDPLMRRMLQMGRDPLFQRALENASQELQAQAGNEDTKEVEPPE